jgi:hypothetical protein
MRRILHLIGIAALAILSCAVPSWAGEYAVLGNGFRLHADRHEVDGSTVRLFSGVGVTEMPLASVARWEQEEEIPQPAPTPQPEPAPEPVAKPTNAAQPKPQPLPTELAALAAKKFALPESFVRSVMKAESAFQPGVVSAKGAIGLMQLMPETARQLGVDPKNPGQNAEGGAHYLHDLLAKYEDDPDQVVLALAAYNAGPAAVDRYHGVPPYRETREYILRVLRSWDPHDTHN